MVITPHHFRLTQPVRKLSHVSFVKDIGISLHRMEIHILKYQHVYLVQLMFASNVLGINQLGDINVLNAQKVVSMIQFFRIVERYVRLQTTRFKFYLLDTSTNQHQHVLAHV